MEIARPLIVALVVLYYIITGATWGWRNGLISTLILALGGFSFSLISSVDPAVVHYGIAPSAPSLSLYSVLLIALLLAGAQPRSAARSAIYALCFGGLMTVGLAISWQATPEQVSGCITLVVTLLAVAAGRKVSEIASTDERLVRAILAACVTVVFAHTLASVSQSLGFTIVFNDVKLANDSIVSFGRMVGLYNHPSLLGKTVLLLFAFLLPLTAHRDKSVRRLAMITIISGCVGTALTVSRTNIIAIAVALGLWFLFSRYGVSASQRILIAILFAVAAVAVVGSLEQRFQVDSEGGDRPELLATGLKVLAENWLAGIGPNSYSSTVGSYDYLASIGYPVHNSFIHMAVEVGVFFAVAFFAPFFLSVMWAISHARERHARGVRATVLLVLLPGIALMLWTGWGIIAEPTIALWGFAFGYLWSPGGGGLARAPLGSSTSARSLASVGKA